jgi:hypothetical protein
LLICFATGDVIVQQFGHFLSLEAKHESFSSFQPMRTRLDVFLHGLLHQSYPELWAFCRKLLLLSHGQATVERGFSVNKEVEADNMKEDTVVAQRVICDYISVCGGVLKVPLTKELLAAAASARSQYRLHLVWQLQLQLGLSIGYTWTRKRESMRAMLKEKRCRRPPRAAQNEEEDTD